MIKQKFLLTSLVMLLTACGQSQQIAPTLAALPPIVQPTQSLTQASAASPESVCMSPAQLTPAMTEGPYYKSNTPQRASLLESNTKGIKLVVSGFVLTADCRPVARAWLDFWQADASGQYDNAGYVLRGHQFTDEAGRYQLTTVIPGLYPGRTEHIHFKVQAPNGPVITSQLFFPDVPQNKSDGIFDAKLLLTMKDASDGKTATFNFVVK
ncbi:MAG: intradiol ring-cleavage dioxygenase [Chloroflexi bacterium]|nr:intradiol ring-cleavage dioxygenase [Chloroflexota bacterium]MBI5080011.1 intradiol ring-cleavage dioxygenase [Chloroflexota bacterium]